MRLRACAAMAVAVLLSGCGVRSEAGAPAASPVTATAASMTRSASLSPAIYRTAAARACRAYRHEIADLPAPRTQTQFTRYVTQVRELTLRRIAQLRALHPPAALSGRVRRLDRYVRPVTAAVDGLSAALRRGHGLRRAVDAFRVAIARLTPPIDTLWKAVGVPACVT